ncbi:MAG: TonB-system energizer ExbB [Arcobacter butzleri]|jgi:biopolymer transport protein ExbB|nr:TonB-system energizer ExbB [Arcobacteraceae bacterium]MDY0364420.1 TonB-system energizer ExbB [Arcobacteraceae bacterium]NLO16804.1 TonB-system energizer ExbB [Aliarcobacter butzleri]
MDIELLQKITDYGIIGLLGLMVFVSVWLWIERLMFYKKIDIKSYDSKESLEIDLTNNVNIIASFASNSPYIGLLGTVIAIIITFYIMGQSGNMDVKNIMTSLALALKATAMGLAVAIPSMFFYNHLARRVEVILGKWEILQNGKN